jgi:NAD(P)-dependent dehydrogenase (short-subunit alcohol dehydrogenase family)
MNGDSTGLDATVLVTGSSRGIGKAIALRAAQDGFDVVVHCRNRLNEAEAVAEQVRAQGRQARVLAVRYRRSRGGRRDADRRRGSAWRLLRRGLQRRHRPLTPRFPR